MQPENIDEEQAKGKRPAKKPLRGLEAELDPFLASEGEEGSHDDLFDGEY